MTDLLILVVLLLTAMMATAVVLTREPGRQAIVLSGYGLVLTILFVVLQAPDVAMSQLGIGTAVLPLITLLTIAKVGRSERSTDRRNERER
ncbi:Na(+)/H(+) antiporter subunit B [Flindersiella endophytica]